MDEPVRERERDGESDRESSMRSTRIASFVVAPNRYNTVTDTDTFRVCAMRNTHSNNYSKLDNVYKN